MEPKIYHITPYSHLPSIIHEGGLWSDAKVREKGLIGERVGIDRIKQRRLDRRVFEGDSLCVGSCVPFYFCPRSVMLYLLHCKNHPDLTYREGQEQIVHLQADVRAVVAWATNVGTRWAFTSGNASSSYFEAWQDLDDLQELDWEAIQHRDWRDRTVKEAKQAEFLVENFFPWHLIEGIGVHNGDVEEKVREVIAEADNQPAVGLRKRWYYRGTDRWQSSRQAISLRRTLRPS